jgi:glycyl-tRNA synthetase beta chain
MDFLLELLSEEIPARMQARARADLEKLFADEIAKAGLKADAIETHATPRRLALVARGLPQQTAAVSEETKGPKTSAPPQALDGFLRKTGLSREQLTERDGILFAIVEKPGRATADLLAEAIPAIIRAFPWPKSMRWGAASASTASLRWVRPLKGIVALLGDDVVPFEVDGIASGAETVGHRFHHPGIITIGNAGDYEAKLRACHVILSAEERQDIIRDGAAKAAAAAGLSVIPDEGLVAENAGLTEYPVPLLGAFDPAFLEVPREVIQLTMRTNQKYFALTDGEGKLAPNFICTANIEPTDSGTAIAAGNAKVLAARLSDAKFFWEQDLKVPLEEQAKKLDQIVFHESLWMLAKKADRIAAIAGDYLPEKIGWSEVKVQAMQPLLRQAAQLAKADLVTGMVGEFPELQGVMGGYYAEAEGLPVAAAIRDHYKPVGPSDGLPMDEIGLLVSLADKVDTLYSFFVIGERPSGSRDPYALRRAVLGVIRLIIEGKIRISLTDLYRSADLETLFHSGGVSYPDPIPDLVKFTIDRLKVQQREAGVRHDLIDAVFALGGEDDLVRLLARVKALQAFVSTGDGANLLAGYKRAANILKKEGVDSPLPLAGGDQGVGSRFPQTGSAEESAGPPPAPPASGRGDSLSYTLEKEEADLIAALDAAEGKAAAAVAAEDFEGAMTALASLRAPIDAFFETVTVNDADPVRRAARRALLDSVRAAVHQVADFSRIEG